MPTPKPEFPTSSGFEPSAKGSSRTLLTRSLSALATIGLLITSAQVMAQPDANTIDFENCVLTMPGHLRLREQIAALSRCPKTPMTPTAQ